jgi:alpha-tubulin suppressor-like RCC1 family protein
MCGTSCVNLSTDPNNCGTCSNSCAGATCYAGVCNGNTAVQVAAGASHDCVLLKAGEVWCWGADDKGQILGTSDAGGPPASCPQAPCRQQPQRIPGLPASTSIGAGGDQTCAVDSDGGVWCWGANASGGLGHAPAGDPQCTSASGAVPCNSQPAKVAGLPGAASAVVAGQTGFACALLVSGAAYCWGDDSYAQLGPAGTGGPSPTPLLVTSSASGLTAGYAHACTLSGTTASCWGSNQYGELGHAPGSGDQTCAAGTPCSATPQALSQGGVRAVHAGRFAGCLDTDAGAYCLGLNDMGQLGIGSSDNNPHPTPAAVTVSNASAIVAMDIASRTTCAIALTQANCWGDDETHQTAAAQGQLSTCGSTPCVLTGTIVPVFNVVEVKTSPFVTIARTDQGKVYAWGNNGSGQLAHAPGTNGDSTCDPAAFDGGTACNLTPSQVGGLP